MAVSSLTTTPATARKLHASTRLRPFDKLRRLAKLLDRDWPALRDGVSVAWRMSGPPAQ